MTTDSPEPDLPTYAYKPALFGAVWVLKLAPDALEYEVGRHRGRVPYSDIRRVRLAFRPVTMQSQRYLAEIWSNSAPKIPISSASWRSITEQERLNAAYRDFVTELHRRMAEQGTRALFITGLPKCSFAVGVVVYFAAMFAFIALTVRALQMGEKAGAAVVGGIFLIFAWQVGQFFLRNVPGRYRPDAIPAKVLPRGE